MKSEPNKSEKRKKYPLFTLLGVLIGFLCVVVIAAIIFPSPVLRYVFSRIESESGISLTFDKAYFYLQDGSFLSIDGLTVRRQHHLTGNFDLKTESVRMPAMVPADFRSPVLLISGLRGTYERVGNEEKMGNNQAEKNETDMPLHALMLVDAEVEFIDRTLEKPFQITIQLEECSVFKTSSPSLLEPYTLSAHGQIDSASFTTGFTKGTKTGEQGGLLIEILKMPLGLLAPYAPALDDIFDSGSMNINIDDLTDEKQRKIRIAVTLLSDCRIKSADEILAPAIQAALQTLDQSALPDVHELKGKIERLKLSTESLRTELEGVAKIVDTLKALAPRDVREKYDKYKNQYDRAKKSYDEWDTKFAALLKDLDRVKVGIVEDTFQHFIKSGTPIEVDIQEVEGEWQFDAYETVVRLVEKNYRTILTGEYQKRIQELRDAVDKLSIL